MFSCCYNILKTYVAPPPANRMEKTRHKPPFCPRKQVTHILVKRKRQVLYYENCSSKISVCTSGSERNLHQLSGMNTRLKRGYTVVFQTPPLAKAKKKKNTLGVRTEPYRRELHHSPVQKVKSTLVWKPREWMARPLPRAISRRLELQYLSQLSCSADS